MFGLNGKNGFVTIEPADETIEVNNTTPHITIKAVGIGGGVKSLNGKHGDITIESSDNSIDVNSNGNNLDLSLSSNGTIIDGLITEVNGLNSRVDTLEQLGSFIGSFQGYASVPTSINGY
jgi:hypothetical protein